MHRYATKAKKLLCARVWSWKGALLPLRLLSAALTGMSLSTRVWRARPASRPQPSRLGLGSQMQKHHFCWQSGMQQHLKGAPVLRDRVSALAREPSGTNLAIMQFQEEGSNRVSLVHWHSRQRSEGQTVVLDCRDRLVFSTPSFHPRRMFEDAVLVPPMSGRP